MNDLTHGYTIPHVSHNILSVKRRMNPLHFRNTLILKAYYLKYVFNWKPQFVRYKYQPETKYLGLKFTLIFVIVEVPGIYMSETPFKDEMKVYNLTDLSSNLQTLNTQQTRFKSKHKVN